MTEIRPTDSSFSNFPVDQNKSEASEETRFQPFESVPTGKLFQKTQEIDSTRSIATGIQIANHGEAAPFDISMSAKDANQALDLVQNAVPDAMTSDTAYSAIELGAVIMLVNSQ